jgi:DNA-binding GntR family transcriptional regulator
VSRRQFVPEPDGPVYLYVQLADYLAELISAGELPVGGRLPGERDMVEEYGVSIRTVRRAVEELRDRDLVQTVPVKGTFVVKRD